MDENRIQLQAEESGERIDALLARTFPALSRSLIQRCMEEGAVTADGRTVKKNAPLNSSPIATPPMPTLVYSSGNLSVGLPPFFIRVKPLTSSTFPSFAISATSSVSLLSAFVNGAYIGFGTNFGILISFATAAVVVFFMADECLFVGLYSGIVPLLETR